ncbi:hypothetical protein M3648_10690 [Micrococcus luteus]|nr:hypothetical protein [Micrococcus luteus]MCM3481407.1 hypothetical protein [Micrococcus luteus]
MTANPKTHKVVCETPKGPLSSKIVVGSVVVGRAQQLGRWISEYLLKLLG